MRYSIARSAQGVLDARSATVAVTLALTVAGCATVPGTLDGGAPTRLGTDGLVVATDVEQCRDRLEDAAPVAGTGLERHPIRVLSWNVQKGSRARWREDLVALASDRDLVLVQEAVLRPDFTATLPDMAHWAFGPGYQGRTELTGVVTFSRVPPRVHCYFNSTEPWLETPKATLLTEYALARSDDTLVVVNVHAINFSIGLVEFKAQLDQVRRTLLNHRGPLILSGDFNTWRGERMAEVENLAGDLGLVPVTFDRDHRKEVFGRRLDHIFVRGLVPSAARTYEVGSSDHNPLAADFAR